MCFCAGLPFSLSLFPKTFAALHQNMFVATQGHEDDFCECVKNTLALFCNGMMFATKSSGIIIYESTWKILSMPQTLITLEDMCCAVVRIVYNKGNCNKFTKHWKSWNIGKLYNDLFCFSYCGIVILFLA